MKRTQLFIVAMVVALILPILSSCGNGAIDVVQRELSNSPPSSTHIDSIPDYVGDERFDEYDDHFVYPIDGSVRAFSFDENGVLYSAAYEYYIDGELFKGTLSEYHEMINDTQAAIDASVDIYIDGELFEGSFLHFLTMQNTLDAVVEIYADGLLLEEPLLEFLETHNARKDFEFFTIITAYDMDTNRIDDIHMEGFAHNLRDIAVSDGIMYYTITHDSPVKPGGMTVNSYNIETGEHTMLEAPTTMFTEPDAVKKLAVLNGKLYILGVHEDYINVDFELWEGNPLWPVTRQDGSLDYFGGHDYEGRILASYDLQSGDMEIVFDDLITDFALTPGGLIMVQAYDSMGGTYFTELDPVTNVIGERVYRDIPSLKEFATDGYGIMFNVSAGGEPILPGNLYYWPLGADSGVSTLVSRSVMLPWISNITYRDGFTYYLGSDNVTGHITLERVKNSAFIDFAPPIQVVGVNMPSDFPKLGHGISFAVQSSDEFALNILSQGAAYDIAIIRTSQDFAHNIRQQGSFYPLGGVPGVQEFLDAAFPYVKDAATDNNGNIWMLPISVDVPGIIYHTENTRAVGIDFAGARNVGDVIENVRMGAAHDRSGQSYQFATHSLLRAGTAEYLRNNVSLDTPEFREMAESIKGFVNERTGWGSPMPFLSPDHTPNPRFLFDNLSSQTSAHLINRDDLSIAPLTGIGGGLTPAEAVFLVVNPNSDRLDKTLEYISHLAGYLLEAKDGGMLADPESYSSSEYAIRRYELYANAEIHFNIPAEVFAEVFDRYLRDEISLDTMITEAGRKLAMYLGE